MHNPRERGATLIDSVVSTALLLVVFVGVAAAFQLSIDVVTNNKARAGAIALANERLEFIKSLSYDAVGTSGGIPAGSLLQSEEMIMNGITYTRRTLVLYADDDKDGLAGADTNGIVTDYKLVKTEVSWNARNGTARTITLVTRLSPAGIEQAVPGGTLALSIIDAASQPIFGARVDIVNASTTPTTDITLYSDENGEVTVIGAPVGAGYEITVSKEGHSIARTHDSTAVNTNPSPGHLTIALNQTTAATFAIDAVAIKNVQTFSPIVTAATSDTFVSDIQLVDMSNTEVSGGSLHLAGGAGSYAASGSARAVISTSTPIVSWGEFAWNDARPAQTNIIYRVYSADGSQLVPDSELPGNAAGFALSPVDLSGISTSTYQGISIQASFGSLDPNETPEVRSWEVSYDAGPVPLQNVMFGMRGTKTIGSGPGGSVYLYSTTTLTTGVSAGVGIANLEWDTYTISVSPSTGYDIASSCPTQPESIAPGTYSTTQLILVPHTSHSLSIDVRGNDGLLVPNATVRLYRLPGFDETEITNACGQSFYAGLQEGTEGGGDAYSIEITAPGYTAYIASNVNVSGTTRLSVVLN